MALERLTQITQVGIQSGITLQNINVEGANVSGVVTATTLSVAEGFNVTGVVTATTFVGNVTGNINPSSLVVTGVSTFQASSHWGDGDVAYFGDDDDLLIFHNSTDSIIRDTGTGDLYIEGGNVIRMTNPTGIETYATFNQDASVELYYDGNKKFETTSGGAKVSGDLVVSGIITSGTSTITIDGPNNSITVGSAFIKSTAIGIGTTTTAGRNAGVGTAIGTLIFNISTGNLEAFGNAGWVNVKTVSTLTGLTATGGVISDYTDSGTIYRSHIFTSSGTFNVSQLSTDYPNTVDYLVVGGGGGGGSSYNGGSGGGGAGGFRTGTGIPVSTSPGSYTITVGAGGNRGNSAPSHDPGFDGSLSSFGPISSNGGGGGGSRASSGRSGGSGGGTGDQLSSAGGSGNSPTPYSPPQGNPGGAGGDGGSDRSGGGGGGASQSGSSGSPGPNQGRGGDGTVSSITGISTYYAGGGGGGKYIPYAPTTPLSGGAGGGAPGGIAPQNTPNIAPSASQATGGGGGGGGGREVADGFGGKGGSGIVVVRYQIGSTQTGTAKATGGAISYTPTTTVHTFYSSGTFTVTNPALTSVDYLVVAGGGAGAGYGGGGAGGFRTGTGLPVSATPGSYAITVGGGGAIRSGSPASRGGSGNPSIFSTITSAGGGGGGADDSGGSTGVPGGSGGGGAGRGDGSPLVGGSGNTPPTSPPQGNPGGSGNTGNYTGGGGGGAGGSGGNAPTVVGGNGGPGSSSSISGSPVTYAGGGGGGVWSGPGPAGSAGPGGGGAGGLTSTPAGSGTQSTGGGGGGIGGGVAGSGGSGIVIIAYPS